MTEPRRLTLTGLGGQIPPYPEVGIVNDVLFPLAEQQFLATNIPGAHFAELNSFYGHDGFLIETEILTKEIGTFINTADSPSQVISLHKIA